MAHEGFETAQDALDFIFAGKARVTLTSAKTGTHFTFKLNQVENEDGTVTPFFVKYLFGPNNAWDGDWAYLGFVPNGERDKLVAGRKGKPDADSFKALAWTLKHLYAGLIPEDLTIQHNDACGMCGRELTDPISVATGFGPVCREKVM